jgi:OFA family oxalate/formate antiporter-like MFS transporter
MLIKNKAWADIPFAPKRWPFFYGWFLAITGALGIVASSPGQTIGVGPFKSALEKALTLDEVQLSSAYMIGTILSSLLLPYAGRLLDRIGARLMAAVVSVSLALSLIYLAWTPVLGVWVSCDSIIPMMIILSLGFLLIRFFGQGCLTMIPRVMIGKWFNHHRGLAIALSGAVSSFGFFSSPALINILIERIGWRDSYYALALIIGVGMSLIGVLFYRDTPEECGLVMDGKGPQFFQDKKVSKIPETVKEYTRKEAVRTVSFWAFALGLSTISLIYTAITFHIDTIGAWKGLDRNQAFALFMPLSIFSIAANLISSWISDIIRHKWQLLFMMAMQAIALVSLVFLNTAIGMVLFIACQGTAGGLFGALAAVVFPRFFGRKHLGAISGLTMSVMVFASAVGPLMYSSLRNLTGTYEAVLYASLLMPVAVFILGLKAENPQEKI